MVSHVIFSSRLTGVNDVAVRIEVDDFALDISADLQHDTRTIDGNGLAITLDEKRAFVALSNKLERLFDPYGESIPPNQDLLLRGVFLLAEAPVGFAFNRLQISPEQSRVEMPGLLTPPASQRLEGEIFTECSSSPCQVDSDDGRVPLFGCSLADHDAIWHDANDHCFCRETVQVGCDFDTECLGRCGPGCGLTGAGIYNLDCAEHDRCCRVHGGCINPLDAECGDEYTDAIDDFLFGTTNCSGGCLPVDAYFVVDLTGSFIDDLPVFQAQAPGVIASLESSNGNIRFGLGKFEDYPIVPFGSPEFGDKAYQRLVDLTFDSGAVLDAIASLFTRGGADVPESQLSALYQAATGSGQDLSGLGFPEASIPSGQQASFRNGSSKIFLLWTDAPFHRAGDSGGPIPYPGPTFQETVDAINALDPPKVIGISSGGGGQADLEAMALATDAVAPVGGVDCDGDGVIDLAEGDPLVCSISSSGSGIGAAIVALVPAAAEPPPRMVEIRIRTGFKENVINMRHKVIPVAVLTREEFDASSVDPASVLFGPGGAPVIDQAGHPEDVDGDGSLDLILSFLTPETGIPCGAIEASLSGRTFEGREISGSTGIVTVGCE